MLKYNKPVTVSNTRIYKVMGEEQTMLYLSLLSVLLATMHYLPGSSFSRAIVTATSSVKNNIVNIYYQSVVIDVIFSNDC